LQPEKQNAEIISIDDGMQTDRSDSQPANAASPSIEIRQPDSNVKLESAVQSLKQDLDTVSTDEGMRIDSRHGQCSNADSPRLEM
jgi:hypothetical protein